MNLTLNQMQFEQIFDLRVESHIEHNDRGIDVTVYNLSFKTVQTLPSDADKPTEIPIKPPPSW